ncbi:MAG: NAD(P)-binding protein, partial [Alphaproteobacteria bacterium]|nr:NAD(P)-binding protein [Alphaproteobacteria bacterium]
TIHDAGPMAGGMMRFGIPKYRLPRDILDGEIARIKEMGVAIELNSKVSDIPAMMKEGGFDAAFVAVGAHLAKRTDIPAREAGKIFDAISVLRDMETDEEPPLLGRRVVVYGGGNTALDMARTAKRLGASETLVVYRRTREQMPAHDIELEEALDEGIILHWLTTIKQIDGTTFTVEKMKVDENGWPQPTGEFETLEADSLVLALGQAVDTSFLKTIPGVVITDDGVIDVDDTMMTGHAGLFAGGDMVPAERTVTVAIGHGKKAARNIDAWLRGETFVPAINDRLADYDRLNSWYYTDADKTVQPALNLIRRQTTFEEIHGGLDETNALFEARRCLSCGNCFECDNCYGVCPDNAVVKLGPGKRFEFNYDFCKGCGVCAAECPCGAIDMVAETV